MKYGSFLNDEKFDSKSWWDFLYTPNCESEMSTSFITILNNWKDFIDISYIDK